MLTIFTIGTLVYFNSLFNGFVWDDEEQIVNNPVIRSVMNIDQAFGGGTFNTGGAGLAKGFYRPLVTIYYMLIYQLFRLHPWGYHLVQIGLHILSGILIYKLLKKWVKDSWAGWGGLIWTVHAGISKTTVYIASVGDVLYTLFGLLALLNVERPMLAGFFVLLTLLSKESAVVWLVILLAYVWLILKRGRWRSTVAILGAGSIYGLLRLGGGVKIPQLNLAPIATASWVERFWTWPSILGNYLRLTFWPIKLTISQHWVVEHSTDVRFWGWGLMVFLMMALILWNTVRMGKKESWLMLGWAVVGIAVVSNLIVPLDGTIDETWLYFPLIGFVGWMMILINHLNKKWIVWGLAVWTIFLAFRTMIRNFDWHDGLKLYTKAIKDSPPSYELENNYGVELFRVGKVDEAKPHFEKSIKLQPKWWFAYNNLGAVYQRGGDLQLAESLYEQSLERADYYLAYENLAMVKLKLDEDKEIERFLVGALAKLPNNDTLNLAMAIVKYRLDNYAEAVFFAKRAHGLMASERNSYVLEAILGRKEIAF